MTLVKICGLRSLDEARVAVESGASYLGFIFWKPGKRYIAPLDAARIINALRADYASREWSSVGVFVDPTLAELEEAALVCDLDYVQLSGHEPAELVARAPRQALKALHVRAGQEALAAEIVASNSFGADRYLLDAHTDHLPGGTGESFDWPTLQSVGRECLVAGGLRPDNVSSALAALAPFGVDVSSGVEFAGGGKDPQLIRAFLEAVRSYDHRSN